jgi:protein gp37
MWDWNANGVKREWILKILEKIKKCPQHIFQILSKRPTRYSRFSYPENVWLGTSIATNADLHRIDELIQASPHNLRFISVEPIHESIDHDFSGLDWIIVGAETGNRKGKITPERGWITEIIETARAKNTPIFIKQNVQWDKRIREFPVRRPAPGDLNPRLRNPIHRAPL